MIPEHLLTILKNQCNHIIQNRFRFSITINDFFEIYLFFVTKLLDETTSRIYNYIYEINFVKSCY